jgi:hypothetical protein
MTRVLVCGGITYAGWDSRGLWQGSRRGRHERARLRKVLDGVAKTFGISAVINGYEKGASIEAKNWAHFRYISSWEFSADWRKHGDAADPIRNQQMIDVGKPHLVIAFPGGEETADMVARAEKAGIPVSKIDW